MGEGVVSIRAIFLLPDITFGRWLRGISTARYCRYRPAKYAQFASFRHFISSSRSWNSHGDAEKYLLLNPIDEWRRRFSNLTSRF